MKGQINLEFLASAFIFLLALGSLITIGSDMLPSFSEELSISATRMEAYSITTHMITDPGMTESGETKWAKNDNRVRNLEMIGLTKNSNTTYQLSEKKINRLRSVDIGLSNEYLNYTEFKNLTGAKNQYFFNFTWKPIVYSSNGFQKIPRYQQKDSLVGYYEFENETGDVMDSSDLNKNGNNIGTTRGVEGAYNSSAFEFNSSSYVKTPSFPIDSNLTVSLWMKKEGSWNDESLFLIGDDEGGDPEGSELRMYERNDKFRWTIHNSTGDFGLVQSSKPKIGQWIHLTGTYNERTNQWRLYKNGELWNSEIEEANMNLSGQPDNGIGLGGNPGDDPFVFYFDGKIDEFRIYNKTLEDEEIESLYSMRSKIKPPKESDYSTGANKAFYKYKKLRNRSYYFLFTENNGRNVIYVSNDWNFTSENAKYADQRINLYNNNYYIGSLEAGSSSYSAILEQHINSFGSNVDSDSSVIRILRYGTMQGEPLEMEVLAW